MSFQQGLSGLNASAKNLEVIGNNVANASTFGAKASRAEFADMYATALNGAGASSIGIGVNLAAVSQQFTQGNIQTTDNPMDLAINGRGFFQLDDNGTTVYSRNGQFKLDRDGFIVNNNGQKLMGQAWNAATGDATGVAQAMQLVSGQGAGMATGAGADPALRGTQLALNLDSSAAVKTAALNYNDATTYNYSTSQTVYDGQGAPLTMTYYFQKTNSNTWDVYASISATKPAAVGPVPLGQPNGQAYNPTTDTETKLTTLVFGTDGKLVSGNLATVASVSDPRVPSIGANQTPANSTLFTNLPMNFANSTQYASTYAISGLSQDGYSPGQLTGISIDDFGVVKANYSNNTSTNLYRLQLADFTNVQGLKPMGNNVWTANYSAGDVATGKPGAGSLGGIQAGALEESNVDLTGELVNMITAQRVYQANAQTIKTQDQVLQTLVNMR